MNMLTKWHEKWLEVDKIKQVMCFTGSQSIAFEIIYG